MELDYAREFPEGEMMGETEDKATKWIVFQVGHSAKDGYRYIVAPLGNEPVLRESEYMDTTVDLNGALGGEVEVQGNSYSAFEAMKSAATFARNRLLQDSGDQESIDQLNAAVALADEVNSKGEK